MLSGPTKGASEMGYGPVNYTPKTIGQEEIDREHRRIVSAVLSLIISGAFVFGLVYYAMDRHATQSDIDDKPKIVSVGKPSVSGDLNSLNANSLIGSVGSLGTGTVSTLNLNSTAIPFSTTITTIGGGGGSGTVILNGRINR